MRNLHRLRPWKIATTVLVVQSGDRGKNLPDNGIVDASPDRPHCLLCVLFCSQLLELIRVQEMHSILVTESEPVLQSFDLCM